MSVFNPLFITETVRKSYPVNVFVALSWERVSHKNYQSLSKKTSIILKYSHARTLCAIF